MECLDYFSKITIKLYHEKDPRLLFLAIASIACETEPLDPSLNPRGSAAGGSGPDGGPVTTSAVGDWDY